MNIIETGIEGLVIIEPDVFKDDRGYFFEAYNKRKFDEILPQVSFVQDNESKSSYGVVRGLHFQKGEHAQAKLIRVVKGRILDVAVDLRKGSSTFGKYYAVELSDENKRQFYIPRGFAHGFSVLSQEAISLYKCDNFYEKSSEGSICWCDPELAIDWKIPADKVIISAKDSVAESFADYRKNNL